MCGSQGQAGYDNYYSLISFDKIHNHLGDQPLGSLRMFLEIRLSLNVGCTIPTGVVPQRERRGAEQGMTVDFSLLSNCRGKVTSCLTFLSYSPR